MKRGLIIVLSLFCVHILSEPEVIKKVINTAWWPPGTEKKEESVGIVSRGGRLLHHGSALLSNTLRLFGFPLIIVVLMTGMMEFNTTTRLQIIQEIEDVRGQINVHIIINHVSFWCEVWRHRKSCEV
jgi:hypothetical protein